MLSYARTLSVTPVAFRENKHHWAFKYWKGDAVETARKIIAELCKEYEVSPFSLPGQLRTEYATCSRHFDYNLFCSCCKVDNFAQTLRRVVGNLLIPFCDLERYMNCGLDYLESYEEIMPSDWNASIEVANLRELMEMQRPWQELVHRVYSRRHWQAVRELAIDFIGSWLRFFEEVQKRTTGFTDEEKRGWTQQLLEPHYDQIFQGELLLTAEELKTIAPQNIAKMIQLSDLQDIPNETFLQLNATRNSDLYSCWSRRSPHLNKRGKFVEQILGQRERHRRSANLMRKLHDPHSELKAGPSRKLATSFTLEDSESFTLPRREYIVCSILIDNAYFAEELYWPILDSEQASYRHSILRLGSEEFPATLEWVLFDLGELSDAYFLVGPSNELPGKDALTAFLVPNSPALPSVIEQVCKLAIATNTLRIDTAGCSSDFALIQLFAHSIEEEETRAWQ
jgi:hypothetical protein